MGKMKKLDWIALTLVVIGAINWGSYGVFNYDIVAKLLGYMSIWSKIIYGAIGLAGLYSIWSLYKAYK